MQSQPQMVGRTRSGTRGSRDGKPMLLGAILQGKVTKPASRGRGDKKTRATRGRGGKRGAAIAVATKDHIAVAPEQAPIAPAPPSEPKVSRMYNELWASGLDSIAFVQERSLTTNDDTTTITLNLIDHIIKPENWNPDLSYNVLSATCFFFASKLTGLHRNTPDKIATATKIDLHLLEAMAGPEMHYDPFIRARLAEALRVGAEDVKKGYKILYEQREGLREYVGEYAERLSELPHPDDLGKMEVEKVMKNMGWKKGKGFVAEGMGIASPVKARERVFPEAGLGWKPEGAYDSEEEQAEANPAEEAAIEEDEEKASEVELYDVELDEFDRFVEENE